VSNNFNEEYSQKNPFIAIPDTLDGVYQGTDDDKDTLKFYEFQGYQIYQVKNGVITVSELDDPSKAALVAQVDLKDGITQLVNYTFDNSLGANVPKEMVNGEDLGIKHSFRMTEDAFATGDKRLVNYKTYHYIAIAYGYNQFKFYDPLDPLKLDGQTEPYIASRKLAGGRGITSFSAIPHNPAAENGGTKTNSVYGDMPQITRKEGQGNGGNELDLTEASETSIVSNNFTDFPIYKAGKGPIEVKVIDPLEVKAGVYQVQFKDTVSTTPGNLDDAYWSLIFPNDSVVDSDQSITVENEQLFLSDGISITIKQVSQPGINVGLGSGVISSSIEYEDPALRWLGGFADREGQTDDNWIRSGSSSFGTNPGDDPFDDAIFNSAFIDPDQDFEGLINKTWAPYRFVSFFKPQTDATAPSMLDAVGYSELAVEESDLSDVPSVDIVFTSDKTKWSRAMVLEGQFSQSLSFPIGSGAGHLELRKQNSVNKEGVEDGTGTGMGWFPGYAINVETGERLNVAFAEDSWLAGENGRDMIWNPTSNTSAGVLQERILGGRHYVYVFRKGTGIFADSYPAYDECATLKTEMEKLTTVNKSSAMSTCVWAGIPMLNEGSTLLETTARVKLRVERSYENFSTASKVNSTLPLYEFDMTGMEAEVGNGLAADSALALINVVPNPYFAYSEYETGKLDRRIKVTNLPETCTLSIYNVNGTLIRRFQKSDLSTSLDWDLTNYVDVPIASGVYLIHVLVPDIGERTLKWYGVMKPTDLNGF
ncbi:MAG: T9SS C-terminal target domain-containing protein, partial [Vicingaceae bacterium]|nr:T9SS C-terminal target domain-containing protein [Vicingaceae bacterium]